MFQNSIYSLPPYTILQLRLDSQYIYAVYSIQSKIKNTNMQKKHITFNACQDPPS
jgi:hypothetical protein